MSGTYTFWVVGGDMRQAYLARLLARDGHRVFTLALDRAAIPDDPAGLSRADCVIFPLPVCTAPGQLNSPLAPAEHLLAPILTHLTPGQTLCGGRVDGETRQLFERHGLSLIDYFDREELTVANAVPTAEGAVQLAMEQLPITIHELEVLVLGYGRVGRITADRFRALGAHVTAAARRPEQLACAAAAGLSILSLPLRPEALSSFTLVVNTVPALLLGHAELSALGEDALVLDLASKPGGVDFSAAQALGVRTIHALALPGKVAPVSAAGYIRDTVYNILRQGGQ